MYFANLSLGTFKCKNFAFRNITCFSKYSFYVAKYPFSHLTTALLLSQNTFLLIFQITDFLVSRNTVLLVLQNTVLFIV